MAGVVTDSPLLRPPTLVDICGSVLLSYHGHGALSPPVPELKSLGGFTYEALIEPSRVQDVTQNARSGAGIYGQCSWELPASGGWVCISAQDHELNPGGNLISKSSAV